MTTPYRREKVDRSNGNCKDVDPILLPNHKIFLSHSGAQKEEFVEQLCVDLERRHRFPFFDKRPSSLPKGERFPPLIKAAVAQCEMMVVVVSEEYFTSKWAMIELHAFMQASVNNQKLKILPLFFGLNVDEFSDTRRQKRWFKVWEKMAKADAKGRIKVHEWKHSLKLIDPFNGMVYNRDSKEIVAYRKEIVSNICKAIPPDIKLDELHVQGRSKLCQVVRQHLENIPNSTKIPGVRVIGLYGVGGIGKTQISKIMCNELDGEFDGKVCHVELRNESEHELVKKVLITLTNTSAEVIQEVGKDKCRDVLLNNMIWKQKTFLAIDNVWDDSDTFEQANLYLRAPLIEGSWVIVTSRFKKTLKSLNIDEIACFEMPELDKDDATNLFLSYVAQGKEFENTKDVDAIEKCVQSCYFGKGEGQGSHYHPLSLKALGRFLQHGGKGPSDWVMDLHKLKESSYLREPVNPVFTILRSNFDRLPQREQKLFMDVSLFFPTRSEFGSTMELIGWLCLVHNEEKKEIEDWLEHLKDSALLEDVDMSSGRVSIHDLYRDFAKLESKGKLVTLDMEKRRWVYAEDALPKELEDEPRDCWKRLTRVCISGSSYTSMGRPLVNSFRMECQIKKPNTSLERMEWKYCTRLVVLKLHGFFELTGVLNFKDLISLRSLDVHFKLATIDSIEGLEELKTLTFIKLVIHNWGISILGIKDKQTNVGQLPASLRVLEVVGAYDKHVLFERNVLALCTNLVTLKLYQVFASHLDLRNCTSLKEVDLQYVKGLKTLQGFALELGSNLQSLIIQECSELVEVCGLDCLVALQSLVLEKNSQVLKLPSLKRLQRPSGLRLDMDEIPGLDRLVRLKSLSLLRIRRLSKLPSLTGFQCLCELTISGLGISEIPNLSGLELLKVVDASYNRQLTSLKGFGDLPAVKSINLRGCGSLCGLSGMSKLTNLEDLDLSDTGVELHEDDMHMLEGLQLLKPVVVAEFNLGFFYGFRTRHSTYRLDFHRHKILQCLRESRAGDSRDWETWTQWGWEEKDLHVPPTGYPIGRGFKIGDVEEIWKLIPGQTTEIIGTHGTRKHWAAFLS